MTGKCYYLTSFGVWLRCAPQCPESHFVVLDPERNSPGPVSVAQPAACTVADGARILVLVAADEAAHIAFENDPEMEALPHPLSRAPISERAAAALAPFGVAAGDDTFTAAEKLARIHPLLRHRVF